MKLRAGDILIYDLFSNEIRLFDACMLEKDLGAELSVPLNLAPEFGKFDNRYIMVPTLNTILELLACTSGLRVATDFTNLGKVTARFRSKGG